MATIDAKGVRIKLRWKANAAARRAAIDSIAMLPTGRWVVRIGGAVRGEMRDFATRREAEAAVHAHYSLLLLDALRHEVGLPAIRKPL